MPSDFDRVRLRDLRDSGRHIAHAIADLMLAEGVTASPLIHQAEALANAIDFQIDRECDKMTVGERLDDAPLSYARYSEESLCSDCPPSGYGTDVTRCAPCPKSKDSMELSPVEVHVVIPEKP